MCCTRKILAASPAEAEAALPPKWPGHRWKFRSLPPPVRSAAERSTGAAIRSRIDEPAFAHTARDVPEATAARSFETRSAATAPMFADTVPSGLATKSKAPSSRHSKVVTAPRCVSDETITTGQIFSSRIICSAVIPSSFGMLMSMVTTSGRSSRALATASSPSRADSRQFEARLRADDSFEGLAHEGRIIGHQHPY